MYTDANPTICHQSAQRERGRRLVLYYLESEAPNIVHWLSRHVSTIHSLRLSNRLPIRVANPRRYRVVQHAIYTWYDSAKGAETSPFGNTSLTLQVHKFFDSYPQSSRRPADLNANNGMHIARLLSEEGGLPAKTSSEVQPKAYFTIPASGIIYSAHYGYVYCMALLPSSRQGSDDNYEEDKPNQLVTGSGDETVKVCLCVYIAQRLVVVFGIRRNSNIGAHILVRFRRCPVSCSSWRDHLCRMPRWVCQGLGR